MTRRRNNAPNPISPVPTEYIIGGLDIVCPYCSALHFPGETVGSSCCHKGKVILPTLSSFPYEMMELMTSNSVEAKYFQTNIRSYNSSLAFASMGAQVDVFSGQGPFCYRIHGQIYHLTGPLHPHENRAPSYAQLYILDSEAANNTRIAASRPLECHPGILTLLDSVLRRVNPYTSAYRQMHQVELAEEHRARIENRQMCQVQMLIRQNHCRDLRRYNAPSVSEVAAIFVDQDGHVPSNRDIAVFPHDRGLVRISPLNPNCDPMTYPLLFPAGDPGWAVGILHEENMRTSTRNHVTMLQFYSYRLAIRPGFSPIHYGRRLFQQYVVDAYVKTEGNRLNYIRQNQSLLRVELYQGLMDYIHEQEHSRGVRIGRIFILPSSFPGSSRAMQQNYQDAMAIVRKFGRPDLFVTFTCNPRWTDIVENLLPNQNPSDRPDLVARVFNLKLQQLLREIVSQHVLGVVIARVHVVEFQKRGLPHAHMLFMLREEDKPRDRDAIDRLVCAEIPSPTMQVQLYDMLTEANNNGYPRYRRRDDGQTLVVGTHEVDNRWVVPYNPYLLVRFNAHINVEVCASVKSVKYLSSSKEQALENASRRRTTLTAWFQLNCVNVSARSLLYGDIPSAYVFRQNQWSARVRGGALCIGRMCSVNPKDSERYHLRLLLLHVAGAQSFEDLRTVDDIVFSTFKEAAQRRGLLADDSEWDACLAEAALFQMPCQLRQLFATILIYNNPTDPVSLWTKYKGYLSEDFSRATSDAAAEQMTLRELEFQLRENRLICHHYGLPAPLTPLLDSGEDHLDVNAELQIGTEMYRSLTPDQKLIVDTIVDSLNVNPRCFLIDGPGGTGKTYVYNTLIHCVRAVGKIVIPLASTGIAATLLSGGQTVHSRFKLPIPLLENSVAAISANSSEAELIRRSSFIIWDEAPMAHYRALEIVDRLLKDIMHCDLAFGGKVVVLEDKITMAYGHNTLKTPVLVRSPKLSNVGPDKSTMAYGHTTLKTPVLVRSPKLSNVGPDEPAYRESIGPPWCCEYYRQLGYKIILRLPSFLSIKGIFRKVSIICPQNIRQPVFININLPENPCSEFLTHLKIANFQLVKSLNFVWVLTIETLSEASSDITIIFGEFNAKGSIWGSPVQDNKSQQVEDMLTDLDLTPLNNGENTYLSKSTGTESAIDITAINYNIAPTAQWKILRGAISDHRPIFTTLNFKIENVH
ncbi:hypothetical protein LAZ67_4002252 [Cordylochernes scorpioides]|uniref:ATP-dependent DNA helicase n=1 Tax=Cordylochernes scorpioides TaxID=51811 RepID=A0ABY6KCM5_9ARAC|nr:hypothetical protein LAZ67_4002252 [Cordylochernes scorpioides]